MNGARKLIVGLAGATPLQPHGDDRLRGDQPERVWSDGEFQLLASRLAERVLEEGWQLAYALRCPFAPLLEKVAVRSLDPWRTEQTELPAFIIGREVEATRWDWPFGVERLKPYAKLLEPGDGDASCDCVLGLGDGGLRLAEDGRVADGRPFRLYAVIYLGGRPDRIPVEGWGDRDVTHTPEYHWFLDEVRYAAERVPVFLAAACGGFAREALQDGRLRRPPPEAIGLTEADQRILDTGVVPVPRRAAGPDSVRAASAWDVSRVILNGLRQLSAGGGR
jgi:hypothetical protein